MYEKYEEIFDFSLVKKNKKKNTLLIKSHKKKKSNSIYTSKHVRKTVNNLKVKNAKK